MQHFYRQRVDYWQWFRLPDADMQAAPAALLRAARRAREIARQTGTAVVVVVRDGNLVEERQAAPEPAAPEPLSG